MQGGEGEGVGSPEGLSTAEGISGGGRTSISRSRGHRRGLSGWGGSTWWRGAWGGVEAVGEGSEQVVYCGLATANTAVFGVTQER
jgi:hypothetical protein